MVLVSLPWKEWKTGCNLEWEISKSLVKLNHIENLRTK